MLPDSALHMLQRVLKRAGLPRIRFHDLRPPYVKLTTENISGQKQEPQATKNGLIVWDVCFGLLHPHGAPCQSLYGWFLQSL